MSFHRMQAVSMASNGIIHNKAFSITWSLLVEKYCVDHENYRKKVDSQNLTNLLVTEQICDIVGQQCWKWPVARWPNAPIFCLGPPEISKLWTLVAQIYFSDNSK